ncbi:gp636 [Bacillus phage G]|uniref:Gp636 n=1 Tax=Bacillus phage G TaxID=2884420 RepID=G3MB16_9CAUD|nr:gp636 [Bacillus phage G]AEO93880.1 gp636 [Bacillus phage G]
MKIEIKLFEPRGITKNGDDLSFVLDPHNFKVAFNEYKEQFVLIEGKRFTVNLNDYQIAGRNDKLMLCNSTLHAVEISLARLIDCSNIVDHLVKFLMEYNSCVPAKEISELVQEMELMNINRLIDGSLLLKDKKKFYELIEYKNNLLGKQEV